MWRNFRRAALPDFRRAALPAAGLAGLAALAGCGTASSSAQAPGKAASVTINLHTVPTIRSVTVSAAAKQFRHCVSGSPENNTASTSGALGFPNGLCWLGQQGAGGSGSIRSPSPTPGSPPAST